MWRSQWVHLKLITSPLGNRGSFIMKHSNQNVCILTYFVYCGILVCSLYWLSLTQIFNIKVNFSYSEMIHWYSNIYWVELFKLKSKHKCFHSIQKYLQDFRMASCNAVLKSESKSELRQVSNCAQTQHFLCLELLLDSYMPEMALSSKWTRYKAPE